MIDKILQEFDELNIEAQKRADEIKKNLKDKSTIVNCPIDYRQFLTKAIEQAVTEERKAWMSGKKCIECGKDGIMVSITVYNK